jgi:hypothetical protein
MQLKSEKREIDGLTFYIMQFPARKCIKLEKKTITYLAPMLTMLEGIKSLEDEIDFSKIVIGIQQVLQNLNEDALEQFIFNMIESTSVNIKDDNGVEKSILLNSNNGLIFDTVFIGKNITVYKLLLEIMKVNKFGFFELMGGGGEITGIFTQMMPKQKIS